MDNKPLNPEFVKTVKKAAGIRDEEPSSMDTLLKRSMDITEQVRFALKPLISFNGTNDIPALTALASKLYYEKFDNFSKDEVVFMLAMVHTLTLIESL